MIRRILSFGRKNFQKHYEFAATLVKIHALVLEENFPKSAMVSRKLFCALAHLGCTREAGTS